MNYTNHTCDTNMAAPTLSRGNSAAREVTKQLVTSADLLLHYCSNRNCPPGRPAFFITVPIKPDDRFRESYYITQLIKGVDHNKKLPANLAGKIHCDTVESIKTKLSDAVFAQWQ